MYANLERRPDHRPERRNPSARLLKGAALIALVGAWAACIPLPATDPMSTPTLTWKIDVYPKGQEVGKPKSTKSESGDAITELVQTGVTYKVTLVAEDPVSGVETVSLAPEGEVHCTLGGDLGSTGFLDFTSQEWTNPPANAGDQVDTKHNLVAADLLDLTSQPCNALVTFHGHVSNYFQHVQDSDLTFCLGPCPG